MNVLQYQKKLNSINVHSIVKDAVNKNTKVILDINRSEMNDGLDIFGKVVGKYSKASEEFAKHTNPSKPKKAGANYNFQDTLALFKGMLIEFNGKIIKFDSNGIDSVEKDLFITDSQVLGVSKENAVIINYDILLPDLQNKIKQILK